MQCVSESLSVKNFHAALLSNLNRAHNGLEIPKKKSEIPKKKRTISAVSEERASEATEGTASARVNKTAAAKTAVGESPNNAAILSRRKTGKPQRSIFVTAKKPEKPTKTAA